MILYILKSTVILFVLYTFYKLFLERETMHVFKRFYLLLSFVIAFIIPFLTYTQYVEPILINSQTALSIPIGSSELHSINNVVQYQNYMDFIIPVLWAIYGIGVVLFGIRFINNLLNIYSRIKHNTIVRSKPYSHVLLQDLLIPHTFLNYLFLNKQKYKANLIPKEVLLHEQTHANQKHSIDILFVELLQIIFWFHPLIYFIKESIKLNHEFLADQAVLNQDIELRTYQRTLLLFSTDSQQPQLTTAINYSLIKKRFTVMKTQTPKRTIWLRSIVILPLLAVLIYGFSDKVIVEKENLNKEKNEVINGLQKITNSNQSSVNKVINIKINSKKQILINEEKLVSLKTFGREIKNIISTYSPEQLANNLAVIEAPDTIDMGFLIDVSEELRKVGVNFIRKYVAENNTSPEKKSQEKIEKASKEQIGEYNKIAKKYNDMPQGKMDIINEDVKRIMYLYRIMSVKQRKNAEPLPVFPPPPPSPNSQRVERTPPPNSNTPISPLVERIATVSAPPLLPENVVKSYKTQAPVIIYEYDPKSEQVIEFVKNPKIIELVEIVEEPEVDKVTDVPFSIVSSIDLINDLAKKGTTFYFEGKEISLDEAVNLVKIKKTKYLSLKTNDPEKLIVNLSVDPIK